MVLPDIEQVARIIEAVVAEEVIPRFRQLDRSEIRTKSGPGDLVTIADEACEQRLTSALTELLPGSTVVGEEGAEADPAILKRLHDSGPAWIIDPVDGTHNFAHGIERFACIVALSVGGQVAAGWIHDPVRQVTAMAEGGQGASLNGATLRAASGRSVSDLVATFSPPRRGDPIRSMSDRLSRAVGEHLRFGCSGTDYLWLAEGRAHVALFAQLKPWDHAAGVLIHREAGGYSALLDGRPYAPTVLDGPMIVAPDPATWQAVRAIVTPEPG